MVKHYTRSKGGYYYKTLSNGDKVRVSKEEYMRNIKKLKKDHSRSKSRQTKVKRMTKKQCKSKLQEKVWMNLNEFEMGVFHNKKQALAVSYAQVNKEYPQCRRYFRR